MTFRMDKGVYEVTTMSFGIRRDDDGGNRTRFAWKGREGRKRRAHPRLVSIQKAPFLPHFLSFSACWKYAWLVLV
ncbi:hypothetical protein BDY24DRAFT_380092 [Mrakia frigida]|uniref:uncharacterized protein n=1 Tax=Mrakia frigida TaxID=29902 RepID=UPI003FCC1F41